MMKVNVILATMALLLVGFTAQAQSTVKIGYTSVELIMDLMPEMEQIGADVQDYQTQLQTNIQTKAADFQKQVEAYQKAAPTMAETARAAKEQELTKLRDDLQKYEQDAQTSYQRKLSELLEPVQTKVINAINAVAAENNYTHIFAETAGQSPILLYTKEEDKFTELVLTSRETSSKIKIRPVDWPVFLCLKNLPKKSYSNVKNHSLLTFMQIGAAPARH